MVGLAVAALAAGCISSPTDPQEQAEPTSVMITPDKLTTTGGMPDRFTADVLDADGVTLSGMSVDWSTSNPAVAVVDRDGLVWSFAEGTTMASANFQGRGNSSPNGKAYGHSKKDAEVTVTQVAPDRPGQVTDLSVASTTTGSATLSFTEVSDGTGSPADYVVRFQVGAMDWGAATDASSGTCSAPRYGTSTGSKVSCTVTDLAADTDYKFQLVAFRGSYPSDMVYGDLSNVASGSTPAPPDPTLQPQPGSEGHPNEPTGLEPFAEHDFSCRPGAGCARAGAWDEVTSEWHQGNLTLVDANDSPVSPTRVIRTIFPEGMTDGVAPVNFRGWASSGNEYHAIYASMEMRIHGSEYENQSVGTKLGFFAYGEPPDIHGRNQGYLHGGGTGSRALVTELPLRFRQQNHVSRVMNMNTGTPKLLTVGTWHQIEFYMELNDLGEANGTLKIWLDGTEILDYTDVVYITPGNEHGFYLWKWNPTWGGIAGDTRTRSDAMDIDHMYLSGTKK